MNNFGQLLPEHFWEQHWGLALKLWRAALGQLRGLAFGKNFGEQLCDQLSGIIMDLAMRELMT